MVLKSDSDDQNKKRMIWFGCERAGRPRFKNELSYMPIFRSIDQIVKLQKAINYFREFPRVDH